MKLLWGRKIAALQEKPYPLVKVILGKFYMLK